MMLLQAVSTSASDTKIAGLLHCENNPKLRILNCLGFRWVEGFVQPSHPVEEEDDAEDCARERCHRTLRP